MSLPGGRGVSADFFAAFACIALHPVLQCLNRIWSRRYVPFGTKSTLIGRISVYEGAGRCGFTQMGHDAPTGSTSHGVIRRSTSTRWGRTPVGRGVALIERVST